MIQEAKDFIKEETLMEDLNLARNYFESFCLGLQLKTTKLRETGKASIVRCTELIEALKGALHWSEGNTWSIKDYEIKQEYLQKLYEVAKF